MKLGMQVGLGPDHIVLDGDPAPPSVKGHSPQFSAHICCDQMAAWIKMSLGMELGLGPGDFVLDGEPTLPSPKGGGPNFRPCLLWPNGCMDKAGTWHGGRPHPRRRCVRWDASPLATKGVEHPPQFSAHFYCGHTAGCTKMPVGMDEGCLLYTSPSPRDRQKSRMPSSA